MKSLNFKNFGLDESHLLKRNDLKMVTGGDLEAASCSATCSPGVVLTCSGSGACTAADGVNGWCEIMPYGGGTPKKQKCPIVDTITQA